ncbi:carboxymuconolactone decarboxylase family protein [Raoultella terrigena]|uniref:carboxymuconolactone decarboxylase family protein n=1 Tax=Raoultella terrigena TaxID=577 RepID=UPI0025B03EA6|nr:carboxymuconolactone decarboxylase family protein [Raoultella terrigena]WJV39037.1 carboxymuconolactone decarboxylase family protein [Raoultella terrigena]
MSRLAEIREQDATGKAAEIFGGIKKTMGKVPNAFLTIGGHSPAALQQALAHNAMLSKGSLNAQELEAINLAVSEATGCDYCLAAHTMMAKRAGYSSEQIHALRRGEYPQDAHLDALAKFVQTLVSTTGTLPEADVSALRSAGFSDQQTIEIISAVSAILFTNMVNRVNDTVVDFPKAD